MKWILFVVIICLLAACGGKVKKGEGLGEVELTETTRTALKQAVDEYLAFSARFEAGAGRAERPEWPYTVAEDYEGMTFTRLPLRVFDERAFLENPEEGRVMACIREPEDLMFFAGRKDGKIVMTMGVERRDGKWCRNSMGMEREEDVARWRANLPGLLERVDKGSFAFLKCYGNLWYSWREKGEPRFSPTAKGEGMTLLRFAEYMVEIGNVAEKNREWLEERKAGNAEKIFPVSGE